MDKIKENISKNLVMLRKQQKLTQQEFGKIFNYSDKAVSKWERGDSLPDIDVLTQICSFYGVEFEWLIRSNTEVEAAPKPASFWYRVAVVLLFVVSIYAIATIAFVYYQLSRGVYLYQLFIWGLPLSFFGAFIYSKKWWSGTTQFAFLSATLWSLLLSLFVQLLSYNVWPIFLIGVPLQVMLVLFFVMNKMKRE